MDAQQSAGIPDELLEAYAAASKRQVSARSALRSATANANRVRDEIESLKNELARSQKAFHLGDIPEERVLELSSELVRLESLREGIAPARESLRFDIERAQPAVKAALQPILDHAAAQLEAVRTDLLAEARTRVSAVLEPLASLEGDVGPGVSASWRAAEEVWQGRALIDALEAARFPPVKHHARVEVGDGRMVPLDSREGTAAIADANRGALSRLATATPRHRGGGLR